VRKGRRVLAGVESQPAEDTGRLHRTEKARD